MKKLITKIAGVATLLTIFGVMGSANGWEENTFISESRRQLLINQCDMPMQYYAAKEINSTVDTLWDWHKVSEVGVTIVYLKYVAVTDKSDGFQWRSRVICTVNTRTLESARSYLNMHDIIIEAIERELKE